MGLLDVELYREFLRREGIFLCITKSENKKAESKFPYLLNGLVKPLIELLEL